MKIPIAKIGKSFGVRGWNKFYPLTDFTSQFKKNATFTSDKIDLTIEDIDLKKGIIKFKGFNTPEEAKKLTNRKLYTTEEKTRKEIELKEGEYFWFDIIGCKVVESGEWRMENESEKCKVKSEKLEENEELRIENGELSSQVLSSKFQVESSKFQELKLGKVKDIQRFNDIDYLLIFTDDKLVKKGYPKRFLVEFKRVVKDVDLENKIIYTNGAFEILESLK